MYVLGVNVIIQQRDYWKSFPSLSTNSWIPPFTPLPEFLLPFARRAVFRGGFGIRVGLSRRRTASENEGWYNGGPEFVHCVERYLYDHKRMNKASWTRTRTTVYNHQTHSPNAPLPIWHAPTMRTVCLDELCILGETYRLCKGYQMPTRLTLADLNPLHMK